jgi:hypothetical protein
MKKVLTLIAATLIVAAIITLSITMSIGANTAGCDCGIDCDRFCECTCHDIDIPDVRCDCFEGRNLICGEGCTCKCHEQRVTLLGDADLSGKVDISDALEILKYLARLDSTLNHSYEAWLNSLIVSDDAPGIRDALEILRFLAKLDSVITSATIGGIATPSSLS